MFKVYIKSGTCGHHDYDNGDLVVAEIPSINIPNKHDILSVVKPNVREEYFVTEIKRSYVFTSQGQFSEFISVYVIKL